jgi:hypothetical protein
VAASGYAYPVAALSACPSDAVCPVPTTRSFGCPPARTEVWRTGGGVFQCRRHRRRRSRCLGLAKLRPTLMAVRMNGTSRYRSSVGAAVRACFGQMGCWGSRGGLYRRKEDMCDSFLSCLFTATHVLGGGVTRYLAKAHASWLAPVLSEVARLCRASLTATRIPPRVKYHT